MDEVKAKIAIALMQGVSIEVIRKMQEFGIDAVQFSSMPINKLNEVLEISPSHQLQELHRQEASAIAERELSFINAHHITPLFYGDDNYPWRLAQIPDAPVMLYQLGSLNLNEIECVSVVGTRRSTSYGVNSTNKIIDDLAQRFDPMAIVSGLAYGIDATAHKAALRNSLPTIACLAHGLNTIYPAAHRSLAAQIINNGGCLLSEYPYGTKAFRSRFLERNRIVAGLSGVTLVMESEIKGGAMSTASLAFNYDREVYALPGRITDDISSGCNHLISNNKAHILINAAQLGRDMGWQLMGMSIPDVERNLFPELEGNSRLIYDYLRENNGDATIDEIHAATSLPVSILMSTLSELEFDGIITRIPGNRYSLI